MVAADMGQNSVHIDSIRKKGEHGLSTIVVAGTEANDETRIAIYETVNDNPPMNET